jgi:hypothetical protein
MGYGIGVAGAGLVGTCDLWFMSSTRWSSWHQRSMSSCTQNTRHIRKDTFTTHTHKTPPHIHDTPPNESAPVKPLPPIPPRIRQAASCAPRVAKPGGQRLHPSPLWPAAHTHTRHQRQLAADEGTRISFATPPDTLSPPRPTLIRHPTRHSFATLLALPVLLHSLGRPCFQPSLYKTPPPPSP